MITPADERIDLAADEIFNHTNKISAIRLKLQAQSNPLWTELAEIERELDNTADLLVNGY